MHQFYLTLILLLVGTLGFSQNSGTLKVSKGIDEPKYHRNLFHVFSSSTFGGESSPDKIRDYEIKVGTPVYGSLSMGLVVGRSYPAANYHGNNIGAFVYAPFGRQDLGAIWLIVPEIELSYRKLLNTTEGYNNMNQYSAGIGMSATFSKNKLRGLCFQFMLHYRYDTNSINTYKGFFPTIGAAARF